MIFLPYYKWVESNKQDEHYLSLKPLIWIYFLGDVNKIVQWSKLCEIIL